jgi:peptidyl-prolyl cis-trans isomerase A (cyclophilin A)
MMSRRILSSSVLLVGFLVSTPLRAQTPTPLPRVRIATELGDIVVEVDTAGAPITAMNFLRYVDGGFYDGGGFHRTVTADNQPNDSIRIAVIQADISATRRDDTFGPIALERTSVTGLRHLDGTISMARSGPDSAVASFFICVGDQPELDFGGRRNPDGQGFAAFGRVVEGMEVVERINASPAEGQSLAPPIGIRSVIRLHVQTHSAP